MVQVSPSSAKKLAECFTVSELNELSKRLPLIYGFPSDEDDLSAETKRYFGE